MNLKEKAARIDLSSIGSKGPAQRSGTPKTGIGIHADALFRDEKLAEENRHLKDKLTSFQDALPTRRIAATRIRPSCWANRHADSLKGSEYEQLKKEIADAAGNVQNIDCG